MMTIVFITVLNLLQPYILHEHLGMDTSVQGDFTGNLARYEDHAGSVVGHLG